MDLYMDYQLLILISMIDNYESSQQFEKLFAA